MSNPDHFPTLAPKAIPVPTSPLLTMIPRLSIIGLLLVIEQEEKELREKSTTPNS